MTKVNGSYTNTAELSPLKWRCRRGIKELDVVLSRYLEEYYGNTHHHGAEALNTAFTELLDLEDPVLYAMLLGETEPNNREQRIVLERLKNPGSVSI